MFNIAGCPLWDFYPILLIALIIPRNKSFTNRLNPLCGFCYNKYRNQKVDKLWKIHSYEKISKKEKRKIDQSKRQIWGELNPIARKPENSKAYNRRRAQAWKKELPSLRSLYL